MARYTGDTPFRETVTDGIRGGEFVLRTDKGELRLKARPPVNDLVNARTDDGRMVTIDLNDPENITIS